MKINQCFFSILLLLLGACEVKVSEEQKVKANFAVSNKEIFQGISLLGDSLFTEVDSFAQKDQINRLIEAEKFNDEDPSMESLIWIGRREAYLGRYDLAIRTFSKAISEYPEAYEPLRHRGHRYITVREFDLAIKDFLKAVKLMEGQPLQMEEDGIPNKLNIPLSNVQFNVWYHLGLAYYLTGDYEKALEAYESCLKVSDNDDLKVATLDWYYMTLIKLDRLDEAAAIIKPVHKNMEIIENDAYFKRILMYKGEMNPEELLDSEADADDQKLQYVTQGYGLGNYYLSQGDNAKAKTVFDNVINTGYWSAFGYIATEMELANLRNEQRGF